jgi:hypothetical protein
MSCFLLMGGFQFMLVVSWVEVTVNLAAQARMGTMGLLGSVVFGPDRNSMIDFAMIEG